jgi:hypothetical protein
MIWYNFYDTIILNAFLFLHLSYNTEILSETFFLKMYEYVKLLIIKNNQKIQIQTMGK